jgi:hypothetical protein
MLLFSFPESLFVQTLRDEPYFWLSILSLLVVAGSFMMTFLFTEIAAFISPKPTKTNR